jgi:hypothetical protein
MSNTDDSANVHVRLDKWLWAARFFKTRSLAAEALDGGKVDLGASAPSDHVWSPWRCHHDSPAALFPNRGGARSFRY